MTVLAHRPTSAVECDEAILQAEARAAKACRDHDSNDEWAAECDLQELWDIRADMIPGQREP